MNTDTSAYPQFRFKILKVYKRLVRVKRVWPNSVEDIVFPFNESNVRVISSITRPFGGHIRVGVDNDRLQRLLRKLVEWRLKDNYFCDANVFPDGFAKPGCEFIGVMRNATTIIEYKPVGEDS